MVSLDRVGTSFDDSSLILLQDVPVVAPESIPLNRYVDDKREFTVALADGRLVIDWSGGERIDSKSVHGRLSFLIGSSALLGAVVESLSQAEKQSLLAHLPKTPAAPDSASSK